MDIGIGLPNTVPGTEGRTLVDWARHAEEAGFSTLGTIGRLVYPNYEELVALSAAAAVTSRIRLTTGVLLAPLYTNSALLAKQAASLDRLSGGRLVLGLGLGGREDDFAASGVSAQGRDARLEEQVAMMKRIWSGEEFGYAGGIGPEPVRPGGPEIILGGGTEASFRRIARIADGWIMGGGTPDMFGQGAAAVDQAWQDAGRPAGRVSSPWPTSGSDLRHAARPRATFSTTTAGLAISPARSRRARRSAPRWSSLTSRHSKAGAATKSSSFPPRPGSTRYPCWPRRSPDLTGSEQRRLLVMGYRGPILVERSGEFATITMNRPQRRNALSLAHMRELIAAFREVGDSDTLGIVLAGNGPVFSAGHDFAEVAEADLPAVRALLMTCTELMTLMQQVPQPVVARVHGLATAAGCQLVASTDLAVASEDAGFAAPGGKGGWFCHTPMVAMARNVGRKRAAEMALSGDVIDAPTALDWGLVNPVVPAAQLDTAVPDLLERVTRGSADSKGIGKQALYAQIDLDQPKAYAYAIEVMAATSQLPDAREGMRAFLEKRKPRWRRGRE